MKKKIVFMALIILVLAGTAIAFQELILQKIGSILVYEDPLTPADAIVVLSGSGTGNRIEAGATLFQRGLGRIIIISGDRIYGKKPWLRRSLYKSPAVGIPPFRRK